MSDMLNPQVINILDVMEYDGEKNLENKLSAFSCPDNAERRHSNLDMLIILWKIFSGALAAVLFT